MLKVSACTLSGVRTLRRALTSQDVSTAALACGRVSAALICVVRILSLAAIVLRVTGVI